MSFVRLISLLLAMGAPTATRAATPAVCAVHAVVAASPVQHRSTSDSDSRDGNGDDPESGDVLDDGAALPVSRVALALAVPGSDRDFPDAPSEALPEGVPVRLLRPPVR